MEILPQIKNFLIGQGHCCSTISEESLELIGDNSEYDITITIQPKEAHYTIKYKNTRLFNSHDYSQKLIGFLLPNYFKFFRPNLFTRSLSFESESIEDFFIQFSAVASLFAKSFKLLLSGLAEFDKDPIAFNNSKGLGLSLARLWKLPKNVCFEMTEQHFLYICKERTPQNYKSFIVLIEQTDGEANVKIYEKMQNPPELVFFSEAKVKNQQKALSKHILNEAGKIFNRTLRLGKSEVSISLNDSDLSF